MASNIIDMHQLTESYFDIKDDDIRIYFLTACFILGYHSYMDSLSRYRKISFLFFKTETD